MSFEDAVIYAAGRRYAADWYEDGEHNHWAPEFEAV